jgi:hypothetical protein
VEGIDGQAALSGQMGQEQAHLRLGDARGQGRS